MSQTFAERPRTDRDLSLLIDRTEAYLAGLRAEANRAAPLRRNYADQQRTIDTSVSQLIANDESEPGRDYME